MDWLKYIGTNIAILKPNIGIGTEQQENQYRMASNLCSKKKFCKIPCLHE